MEADDDGLYVLKFRGAGQGPKALAAEIVAGELARGARAAGARAGARRRSTPRSARAEPDPEIQDLIAASAGVNLGVDFLPGALPVHARPSRRTPTLAADVVWLDALVTNVDRTPRNPNLLRWHGNLWLIDHGAALYAFHGARPAGAWRAARSRRSATTCCCPPPARSLEADARLARARRPGDGRRAGPGRVGATARRTPSILAGAARGAARVGARRPSVPAP